MISHFHLLLVLVCPCSKQGRASALVCSYSKPAQTVLRTHQWDRRSVLVCNKGRQVALVCLAIYTTPDLTDHENSLFCLVWGFWEPYEAFEFFKIGFLASLLEFSACLARNSGRCHLTRKSPILQPSNFKCFLQIPGSPRPKINPIYAVSRSSLIGRWLNPKINFLKQCGIKWHNLLFTLPTAVNQDYWR